MRWLWRILVAVSVLFAAASCAKYETRGTDSVNDVDPTEISSIDVYSTKVYTKSEFIDFVGESFDDYLGDYLTTKANVIVKKIVRDVMEDNSSIIDETVADELDCSELIAGCKWGIKVYNYSYNTVSYSGEPIKLSAALCVPVILDGETPHIIKALSLCPPHMPLQKEFCPTVNGTMLMARVFYNHAVVVPDYQGRGITSSGPYSSLHTHDHAVQAIHAALAAQTILANGNFRFAKDFPLYNVGVSEGGETAYEAQKIIENDLNEDWRKRLNLKLTFCANGIAQHPLYVDTQMSIYEYVDWEGHKLQMDFYKDAFDCFTEDEKQGHEGEEFYSPELLDTNGKVILDHPLIKVLKDGLVRNDIPYNWNPKHKLSIAGSEDDNDVLFDDNAMYMYNLLKETPDGAPNEKVHLMSFRTPISAIISDILGPDMMFAHIMADAVCFIHAIEYEDPGSEPIRTSLFGE